MGKFEPRTYSINDFLGWDERRELEISPKYQRRTVWSQNGKSYLMDSIVRGFPLPQFFIREKVLRSERRNVKEVVDGQQRLRTIIEFVNDGFTILPLHNKEFARLTYSQLPEEIQERILTFPLNVNVLVGTSEAEVLETFSRLNAYSVPLNRIEKLNAQYTGDFKQKIDELARTHLIYWQDNGIMSAKNIARMLEVQLTAELVGTMLKGLQNKKEYVEDLYKQYDAYFPQYNYISQRLGEMLELIQLIIGGVADITELEFRRPPLFFSIVVALYDVIYGLCSEDKALSKKLDKSKLQQVRQELFELNEAVANIKGTRVKVLNSDLISDIELKKSDYIVYSDFANASISSTDTLTNRRSRHDVLKSIFIKCFIDG